MGIGPFEELEGAVGDLLALDADQLDDTELHQAVVTLGRQSHRLAAMRARLISAWDARGIWADDGSRTAASRLGRETSTSTKTAKREVARARALRTMSHTAAALADGALSPDHVDLLARADSETRHDFFVEHEETLVEQCKVLRYTDAYRLVEYWRQHADAEATEDEATRQHESRSATTATTIDGMVDVHAWLDPIGGAEFVSELERLVEQFRLQDAADGNLRTIAQRRADALVEMARRSRTAADGGLRPRPLISVLVGEETLKWICELAYGTIIAPGQIVPLLKDADLERVVFDGPDRVMAVSRKRTFTGALRRAIEVRDRHCQHPSGCDEPAANCDVDHITPHGQGGETSQENGRIRCYPHNRDEIKRNARPPNPPPQGQQPDDSDDLAEQEPDDRAPPANAA